MENDACMNLYGKEGHGCTMAAKDNLKLLFGCTVAEW
jgi:hypothetical protein